MKDLVEFIEENAFQNIYYLDEIENYKNRKELRYSKARNLGLADFTQSSQLAGSF